MTGRHSGNVNTKQHVYDDIKPITCRGSRPKDVFLQQNEAYTSTQHQRMFREQVTLPCMQNPAYDFIHNSSV